MLHVVRFYSDLDECYRFRVFSSDDMVEITGKGFADFHKDVVYNFYGKSYILEKEVNWYSHHEFIFTEVGSTPTSLLGDWVVTTDKEEALV